MPQFGRPSADTYNGDSYVDEGGATSNLFQSIDEANTAIDDADYIRSPNSPSASEYATKLTAVDDPGIHTGHVLRVRMKKDLNNLDTLPATIELREAYVNPAGRGTLICTLVQASVTTSFVTYEHTLSSVEAALITDYTDLYIVIYANP